MRMAFCGYQPRQDRETCSQPLFEQSLLLRCRAYEPQLPFIERDYLTRIFDPFLTMCFVSDLARTSSTHRVAEL